MSNLIKIQWRFSKMIFLLLATLFCIPSRIWAGNQIQQVVAPNITIQTKPVASSYPTANTPISQTKQEIAVSETLGLGTQVLASDIRIYKVILAHDCFKTTDPCTVRYLYSLVTAKDKKRMYHTAGFNRDGSQSTEDMGLEDGARSLLEDWLFEKHPQLFTGHKGVKTGVLEEDASAYFSVTLLDKLSSSTSTQNRQVYDFAYAYEPPNHPWQPMQHMRLAVDNAGHGRTWYQLLGGIPQIHATRATIKLGTWNGKKWDYKFL